MYVARRLRIRVQFGGIFADGRGGVSDLSAEEASRDADTFPRRWCPTESRPSRAVFGSAHGMHVRRSKRAITGHAYLRGSEPSSLASCLTGRGGGPPDAE